MSNTAILFKSASNVCNIVHNFSQWWFVAKFGCGCTWSSIGIVRIPFVPMQCDTLPSSVDHLTRVRVLIARLIIEKSGKFFAIIPHCGTWSVKNMMKCRRAVFQTVKAGPRCMCIESWYHSKSFMHVLLVLNNRTKSSTLTCKKS